MNVNLARKWRSRTFDQVIGQNLPVKMLKNSLYLDYFFPVYLFSGQRGCGKTSVARIFAAAANCEKLTDFQRDPKNNVLPCLKCVSCVAMQQGNHPDFIEIDAASHTGVDNVRNIIEAATLLPVLARKRIYLIDEAHMLSKAAFNAFLKLLEEPPTTVFFILATTEAHKIIDTVSSRCFQLLFRAIDAEILAQHLQQVCITEGIAYEPEALLCISKQVQGSARDALNLLEQARFAYDTVTKQGIAALLNDMSEELVFALLDHALNKTSSQIVQFIQENKLEQFAAHGVWQRCLQILRDAYWQKCNIQINDDFYNQQLAKLIAQRDSSFIVSCMQLLYEHEEMIVRSDQNWGLLEFILLKMNGGDFAVQEKNASAQVSVPEKPVMRQVATKSPLPQVKENSKDERVDQFLKEVEGLGEPLLTSVFKQAKIEIDSAKNTITFTLLKKFVLFNEVIETNKPKWFTLLQRIFGQAMQAHIIFDGANLSAQVAPAAAKASAPVAVPNLQQLHSTHDAEKKITKTYQKNTTYKKTETQATQAPVQGKKVDISDKEQWQKTHTILSVFSGTVTQVAEDPNAETF